MDTLRHRRFWNPMLITLGFVALLKLMYIVGVVVCLTILSTITAIAIPTVTLLYAADYFLEVYQDITDSKVEETIIAITFSLWVAILTIVIVVVPSYVYDTLTLIIK